MGHDHILVHSRDMSVRCTLCGDRLLLELPVNLDVWIAAATKFGEVHVSCAPPEGEASDEYILHELEHPFETTS